MKLKIMCLKWSAGVPVAMVSEKTAKKLGVHLKGRISIETISKKPKKINTVIDTVGELVKDNEIIVSNEIFSRLDLKKGESVNVNLSLEPPSLIAIKKKLNKKILSKDEIRGIIRDITNNSLAEAEIALFVSGMHSHGMNLQETIFLIDSLLEYGEKMDLKQKIVVDKHSIGGIPGNRTTPIVVSICAAAGLLFPKNSSRAITSAAGTADVIEVLSKVDFSIPEIKKILSKTNACMVWGGGLGFVPVDSKIIETEKAIGLDPQAQLLASIMSKKLAAGSTHILIDIPYGKNAKMPDKKSASKLKSKFEFLGKHYKLKMKVVMTEGAEPIGNGIGPSLEMIDVIKVLDPSQNGPERLVEKSLFLAGQILELAGKAKKGEGIPIASNILNSGRAYEKFKQIITAQGGKLKEIKYAKFKHEIKSPKSGRIISIDNKKINELARVAGSPTDKYSGLYLSNRIGQKIEKNKTLITIYSESKPRMDEAISFFKKSKPILFE
jgi:AMP phosphorylase